MPEPAGGDAGATPFANVAQLPRQVHPLHWLESLAPVADGSQPPGLLIGLFGDENQQSRELDWTVKRYLDCARRTHRDFIWHWMEEPLPGDPEWLASHIETHLARKLSALDPHGILGSAGEYS